MEKKKNNLARITPHSIEAEQSVLGCCLLDENAMLNIMMNLDIDDFYVSAHKTIFESMQSIYNSNKPIDYVTLTDELETQGVKNLFTIGDGAGVTRGLMQASASGVHVARVIASR